MSLLHCLVQNIDAQLQFWSEFSPREGGRSDVYRTIDKRRCSERFHVSKMVSQFRTELTTAASGRESETKESSN